MPAYQTIPGIDYGKQYHVMTDDLSFVHSADSLEGIYAVSINKVLHARSYVTYYKLEDGSFRPFNRAGYIKCSDFFG